MELVGQTAIPREASSGGNRGSAVSVVYGVVPTGQGVHHGAALRHGLAARAGLMGTLASLTVVGRIIEPCRHRRLSRYEATEQ